MSKQWHYTQGDKKRGPVSSAELKRLAASGTLRPNDMVCGDGMEAWVWASQIEGLSFSKSSLVKAKPLTPSSIEQTPIVSQYSTYTRYAKTSDLETFALLGYRVALIVVAIAVFLPWAQTSSSSSLMGNGMSSSVDLSGTKTTCGMIALLAAGTGFVLSFLKPVLKDKAKFLMGGVGGIIILLAIVGVVSMTAVDQLTAGVLGQIPAEWRTMLGVRASNSAKAALGVYITLIAGVVSTALGFMTQQRPPATRSPRRSS